MDESEGRAVSQHDIYGGKVCTWKRTRPRSSWREAGASDNALYLFRFCSQDCENTGSLTKPPRFGGHLLHSTRQPAKDSVLQDP